jgi:peptide/nickel transport system substrate-binding protein
MRKVWSSVVAAAVGLAVVAAASASGGGSNAIPLLRIGVGPISTLDQSRTDVGVIVDSLALDTLMKINANGTLQPNVAQSVTHPGKAVYVYHLRHGIKFWDGSELTAADVANSLNYERYPGSQAGFEYTSVKSITATDTFTVAVTLKHPDAGWPFVAAQYPTEIFEKAFQQAHKTTFGQPGTLIMGTGPWMPVSLDPTRGVELDANPHWWGGKVPIAHISVKFFSDETSEALALRAGEIDVVPQVSGPAAFAAASATKVVSVPSCQAGFIAMGVNTPPWNDVHVRRAVAYAINRRDIATADGGYVAPLTTLIPPSQLRLLGSKAQVDALLKSLPSYPFSIAKAKAELAKSAYPHGFTATTLYPQDASFANLNQAFAAELGKIGINLQLTSGSFGEWLKIFNDKSKNGFNFSTWGCLSPDPSYYPGLILGSNNLRAGLYNYADYAPPAVDTLIADARASTNPAKRLAVYGQLLKRIAADVPYVPLFVQDANLGISSKFRWPGYIASFYSVGKTWALNIKAA